MIEADLLQLSCVPSQTLCTCPSKQERFLKGPEVLLFGPTNAVCIDFMPDLTSLMAVCWTAKCRTWFEYSREQIGCEHWIQDKSIWSWSEDKHMAWKPAIKRVLGASMREEK